MNDVLPHDNFKEHFRSLSLDNKKFNTFQQEIIKKFEELKDKQESYFDTNVLNSAITPNEILKAIKSLKMVNLHPLI